MFPQSFKMPCKPCGKILATVSQKVPLGLEGSIVLNGSHLLRSIWEPQQCQFLFLWAGCGALSSEAHWERGCRPSSAASFFPHRGGSCRISFSDRWGSLSIKQSKKSLCLPHGRMRWPTEGASKPFPLRGPGRKKPAPVMIDVGLRGQERVQCWLCVQKVPGSIANKKYVREQS